MLMHIDLDSIPTFIHQDLPDLQNDVKTTVRTMMCRASCRLMMEEPTLAKWAQLQREHMEGESTVADALEDFLKVMRVCQQVMEQDGGWEDGNG